MAQVEMYAAKANSPATELTAALTDIATTVSVLDASKLPDAPNIATIGVDESAETIQYAGKSGNDLTGVTRGFSGTVAKAWAIGVGVARYFTAYDADALRENVADVNAQLADTAYNVRAFGAIGDGVTDDTDAINACIIAASANGVGNVMIPAGTYMIQGATGSQTYRGEGGGIRILSGIKVTLDPGAILKQIPTSYGNYNIVYFAVAENAGISGGTIIGDRSEHTGSTGEWGYGIGVFSSANITVENMTIKDCWGDGIVTDRYIDNTGMTPEQIQTRGFTVNNVRCFNNRRQGMSIASLVGGKISGCTFSFTNGTAPQCGIDIEPLGIQIVEDVVIDKCYFEGNESSGLLILYADRITVSSCFFKNNKSLEGQLTSAYSSNLLIANNQFISSLIGGGLKISDVTDAMFTNNKFIDGFFYSFGSSNVVFDSNTINFESRTPTTYFQISASGLTGTIGGNIKVTNNTVTSLIPATSDAFFECNAKSIFINNNNIGQARQLLSLHENSYAEIVGNFIIDMSIGGVNIATTAKAKIENNTFSGICYNNDGQSIIRVRETADATITNNMFYKNRIGGGDLGTGRPSAYLRIESTGIANVYDNFIDTLTIVNLSTATVIVPRITYRNLPTTGRPASPKLGDFIFDTTLNKPIWWTGANWKDAAGTTV